MLLLGKAAERNFNGFHDCAKSAEVGDACISNEKGTFTESGSDKHVGCLLRRLTAPSLAP